MGPEDLQLAVELNLPLLAPEPDVAALYSSKSGNKRIFAAADVPVAPGAHDIFEEEDFYRYFAKLIVDHLDCQLWVMKIDNEFNGRGIASFDPSTLKVMAALRREKATHSVRWKLPEILAGAQERMVQALKENLAKKAVMACPSVYNNSWDNFLKTFFRVGGVIEACPAYVIGSPSVNLLIEPDGTVNLLNSHDQLFSSNFVYAGATFPSSAPADLLHSAGMAIGRTCFREGIIGYVGVDFVVYFDTEKDRQRLWAVDLNLRMTQTQTSFILFDFLMKGRYHTNTKPLPTGPTDSPTTMADANRIRYTIGGQRDKNEIGDDRQRDSQPSSVFSQPRDDIESNSGDEEIIERGYSVVNYIYQPNLATVQFGSFFNLCRLKGVSFDLRSKQGTAFLMMDSLASGTLGLLCVGAEKVESLSSMLHGLTFLQEQVGLLRLSEHVYADESNLLEVIDATRALLRAKKNEQKF